MAGLFDDLTADLDNDLTRDLPPGKPLDPNSLRLNLGFGQSYDVPVPPALQPVAKGAVWVDDNVAAPLARGAVGLPGLVGDALKFGWDKIRGNPTNFGGVTRGAQDVLGMDARPHDAGFGTDVMEALGGGLGVSGGIRAVTGMGSKMLPTLAREVPSAVTGVLGGYAGGAAGEALGGETGRTIGEILGGVTGGMAPTMADQKARSVIRNTFAKDGNQSADAYRALEAAGVTPRPGLVGNKQAARVENSAANFPFVGGVVQRRQNEAFEQFQKSLYDTTDQIGPRAVRDAELPAGPDMIGARMRLSANAGEENLRGQFRQGYEQVFDDAAPGTLVTRDNLDAEIGRQNAPWTGESRGTQQSVGQFVDNEITPLAQDRVTYSEYQPPMVERQGVPLEQARKARTEAFYDAQGGKMVGGATEQVRGAWTKDIEDALMNDPAMVRQYPDPADRAAQVERLRVLDTEYALANAKNVSRAGAAPVGDNWVVGGDFPALKTLQNAETDRSVFNLGSDPGRMAVLQRTDPEAYPGIAADTVRQKAQANAPYGDINVSPQNFSSWYRPLGENERAIFTNEGFDPRRTIPGQEVRDRQAGLTQAPPMPVKERLDNLSDVGELFRQSGLQANPSGTAPTLAMMGALAGLFTRPIHTAGTLGSAGVLAHLGTSQEMAKVIAGMDPSFREAMLRALVTSVGRTGSQEVNTP